MALAPIPFRIALLIRETLLPRQEWINWWQSVKDAIDAAAQRAGSKIALTAQAASLSATTLLDVTTAGLYRVTYYARITQPATTSSSLTVTVRWTDGGVAQSASGAAMTGNTTTTQQSGSFLVNADQGTPITIETTRVSSGATPMQYLLSARTEALA